ncbi:MAG TPA: HAD-IIIC family phosphatase [Vicinamibacterales bacterium]|nr:HAD-IIIC family phosphatase [Vicinamibacterales bacterium]
MYEAEVNDRVEAPETLPPGVLARFSEYRASVEARTLLPWGEHCTECAWPACYATCELYEPRTDGACRQFVDGVVRIPNVDGAAPYLQKITFRRWAKLWTLGNIHCHSVASADRIERLNILVGAAARLLPPLPGDVKPRTLRKIAYVRKQRFAERVNGTTMRPDFLVCEVFNPNDRQVTMTLSIREQREGAIRRFQHLITLPSGFSREKIALTEIERLVATSGTFEIELVPNDAEGLTLYFGLIDFVKERVSTRPQPQVQPQTQAQPAAAPAATCKCVVWDLDNTLWDGTLVEDGADGVRLRDGIVNVIKELDSKGILQSVASKNNREDALARLQAFGIADYFLYPQVHWQPKSGSIAAIARALNIGIDTLMFVDDQEFERQEVSSGCPSVRTIDARDAHRIPAMPEFDVPVTDESRTRRVMYRQEEQRSELERAYTGDYVTFLKQCDIRVEWSPLQDSNLQRVYELAQRTNQMNFSGNRYSVDALHRLMADTGAETYVLRCRDRFGSYGIVGFAVVDLRELRLVDLMFSCRVQGKRVEHALLAWLLRRHLPAGTRDFLAALRKTKKNAPSAAVFPEMGFEEAGVADGVTTLRYPRTRPVADDGAIDIRMEAH